MLRSIRNSNRQSVRPTSCQGDQIPDIGGLEAEPGDQFGNVVMARHFPVLAQDRADHRGIAGPGAAGQFDRGFQRGRTIRHAAGRCDQRKDVAGGDQIVPGRGRIDRNGASASAIPGTIASPPRSALRESPFCPFPIPG